MNKTKIFSLLLSIFLPLFLVGAVVTATTTVGNNVDVGGTFDATGVATLDSTLTVAGATTLNGDVTLGNAATDTITSLGKVKVGLAAGATGIALTGTDPDFGLQTHTVLATDVAGWFAGNYTTNSVTVAQTGNTSAFGSISELYLGVADTTTVLGGSNYGATWGNLEITGTTNIGASNPVTPTYSGAIIATIIAPATMTVPADRYLAGVIVDSNLTANYTNNGVVSGILIRKSSGKDVWPVGLRIVDSSATTGIGIGTATTGITIATTTTGITIATSTTGINFSGDMTTGINFADGLTGKAIKIGSLSSAVPGSGAELNNAGLVDASVSAVEVNADDNDTARTSGTQGIGIKSRLMIYAGTTQEDWAIDGLTKIDSVLKTQNVTAGVMGRFESTAASSTLTAGSNAYFAGVIGRIGTGSAIALGDGSRAATILAFGNNLASNAFTGDGKYVGVCVTQSTLLSTALEDFDYGIEVMDDVAATGIKIGTVSTADIELSNGATIDNTTDKVIALGGSNPTDTATAARVLITPQRTSNAPTVAGDVPENFLEVTGYITGVGALGLGSANTRGIYVDITRPEGTAYDTVYADTQDVGVRVHLTNLATANATSYKMMGLEVLARSKTGGNTTNLIGAYINATNDSSPGAAGNVYGVQAISHNDGVASGNVAALYANDDSQSATGNNYGVLIDANGSGGIAKEAAIAIKSTTGSWNYGLDLDAISAFDTADIRLSNAMNIYSGTAVTCAAVQTEVGNDAPIGSLYVGNTAVATTKPNLYVKILDVDGSATNWERVVTQASD